jgi:beta-1,4-N-acetylglucosaminyltransferase
MRILVVLGDGGHTRDTLKLVELLGPRYEYSYMMSDIDKISEEKIKFSGPVFRVPNPRGKRHNLWRDLYSASVSSTRQLLVLLQVRPKAILNGGPGIGVPISFFGRLIGVKIIYLENGCRVYTLSASGKLLYWVAHLFFVQWPTLKEKYPRATYAGRLS